MQSQHACNINRKVCMVNYRQVTSHFPSMHLQSDRKRIASFIDQAFACVILSRSHDWNTLSYDNI